MAATDLDSRHTGASRSGTGANVPRRKWWSPFALSALTACTFLLTSCSVHLPGASAGTATLNPPAALLQAPAFNDPTIVESPEGLVREVTVTAGPFDIHRKYRSMEGPYATETFRVADLLATKHIAVNEPAVKFVENGNQPSMSASAANDKHANSNTSAIIQSNEPKQLIWAKGVKLIVLDEHDKPLPTGEFICHFNIDVDPRNTIFPEIHTGSARLFTLTQGQTDFHFPEGYGVPLSSKEFLHISFQAANRTTTEHRRIKHLCTIDFVKDSELKKPLKALSWYTPYVAVEINNKTKFDEKSAHGPTCMVTSTGENAPNAIAGSITTDANDKKMTGHWSVPPGVQPYICPISESRDYGFSSEDRTVRAVWTHVHPLCQNVTLMVCDGKKKVPAWSTDISTKTDHGLEIAKIGDLYFKDGVVLPKGKHFEINSVYNNTTGITQDSMVSQGIFYDEPHFIKPDWKNEPQLTAGSTGSTAEDYNGTDRYSLFNTQNDGPLLTEPKTLEVTTSVGKLHMVLDPSIAPEHATQLYKLFKAGAFDGTNVIAYQPSYIFQIGSIDIKHDPKKPATIDQTALLRRLPLEVTSHREGRGLNKKWSLSMARSHAEDSAVSSFSILLDDAPHLNNKYTVFGRLVPDAVTLATIKKMITTWEKSHAYFISAKDVGADSQKSSDQLARASAPLDALADKTSEIAACNDRYCGIKPGREVAKKAVDDAYPLFDTKSDGPLLTSAKTVEMKTSAGTIHLVIDPAAAPVNATQMYKLFHAGAFDGTNIVRYEHNFVLQTALAETKADGFKLMPQHTVSMLRRLPLEVAAQNSGKVAHKKYALSMAHGDDPNSAVTSFSILLGNAPHLDKKYTIFGHAASDPETVKTIEKIESEWASKHPHIISVRPDQTSIATSKLK
ncbi:MAG TPA: peptidylprolyl isomerase [Drouetiella sp.]